MTVAAVADSGESAIARAADSAPDLVLMDIRLKGKTDGIDAATSIRERFDVPVVFLTAHADAVTLTRAKAAGPLAYLTKPFTGQMLRVTIEMALNKHAMDRTARKLLETQKVESLGRLAGGIAHDFGNLMVPIMGNVSLAALEVDPKSSIADYLNSISSAAERAAVICRQMLAFSGNCKFEMAQVHPNAVITDFQELLRVGVPRRIELSFDLTPDLPDASLDVSQVQQAVMNLVLNAVEAIPAAGSVVVRTTHCELTTARDPGLQAGPYVVIDVSDDGTGMDTETQERIFEPFFTTKSFGRGLGLAAAQGIARAHNGDITVHSVPGQGSTFRIYLTAVARTADNGKITVS
jgi:two-component system, cell cycle sensor histidine kinase and response regulator CckA